ncbi:MAG: ATP synthase F0 subunit B [Deltaproteobacteria bacterium]|nr:ATP synthase F0 subunit B [Deltaproteobacteria bacterium]MBI3293749.1 ATP synthase F0 subunit B [Deltaproteobacteria bacterium]
METAVISSLVNFILVVGTLVYAGRKPLAQFLGMRSDAIRDSIAEAEALSGESQREFSHWSDLMVKSSDEARKGRADSEELISRMRASTLANARREAERIEKEIGLVTGTEYAKARQAIEKEISVGSADLAKNFLSENMNGDVSSQLLSETLERVTDGNRS